LKKVVLTGIRKFDIVETDKPSLARPDDVLLKVLCVGVCGSDMHYFSEGKIGDQVVDFPFVIGHEFSARVEAVGMAVKSVKPGDVVAVDPLLSCGKCEQCLKGRENTCLNQRFVGAPGQAEGCLVEYIVMPAENCFVVPKDMNGEDAALIEPLSIGYYASEFLKNVEKRSSIAILGVGPIGLSVLMSMRVKGFESIYCSDKLDYRLAVAKQCGAVWTGNPDREEVLKSMTGAVPQMFDVVFECCGEQEALDQAVDLLKPGGTLLIVGIPDAMRISFDVTKIRRKEISIQNVRRQNRAIIPCVELTSTKKWSPRFMITHRFPYTEVHKAFDMVANYKDGVIKALVGF